MIHTRSTRLLIVLLFSIGLGLSSNLYSQTVVQWYTSMGDFRAQLREDLVPNTAQNFIDLTNSNFYDDLIFHRVMIEFMIQDGCPDGTGYGGPGYTFDDEFHPDLRHDEPGILSMANSGPNTNGSQYFITVVPTEWLDDAHAVFGKIIDGMEVVYAISEVPVDLSNNKPYVDVVIDSIRVVTGDPVLSLTGPADGTKWNASVDNNITWDSEFVADVKIEFSSDYGQSWTEIVESTSANTRSFEWPAPNIISTECLVKISDAANPGLYDITETPFTLCKLDLISPNGYAFYRVGSPVEVTWTSEEVGDLTLSYTTDVNGEWTTVEENISAGNNSYSWIPEEASSVSRVQLKETGYPEVIDESNNNFVVFRLDLTSPSGGENLEWNDPHEITWDSEIISSVKIEFSSDNMESWSSVTGTTTAGSGAYAWTVPSVTSPDCFIKLTTPGMPDLYSVNATPFSISEFVGISDQLESNIYGLNISPNPVNNNASIFFSIYDGEKSNLQLEIYNTKGEVVLSQSLGKMDQGNHQLKLDLQELPQGLYVIKLKSDDNYSSQKFIKNTK